MDQYPTWCALKKFTSDDFLSFQNIFKNIPITDPEYNESLFYKIQNSNHTKHQQIKFTVEDICDALSDVGSVWQEDTLEGFLGLICMPRKVAEMILYNAATGDIGAMFYSETLSSLDIEDLGSLGYCSDWLLEAARLGHTKAMRQLGWFYVINEHSYSCDYSGECIIDGKREPKKSNEELIILENAKYWWKQAAEQGDIIAMICMARIHSTSEDLCLKIGSYKNERQELHWFKRSADEGTSSMSMFNTGRLYLIRGEADVNYDLAFFYLGEAAKYDISLLEDILRLLNNEEKNFRYFYKLLHKIYIFTNRYISKDTEETIIKLQYACWKFWFEYCALGGASSESNNNLDQSVSHYTSLDSLEEILPIVSNAAYNPHREQPTLRLTHLSGMNDPQEGKSLFHYLDKYADSLIYDNAKIFRSYASNRDALRLSDLDLSDNNIFNIFLTSFSANNDNLSQWRAYGNNAAGVALEFQVQPLLNDPNMLRKPKGTKDGKDSRVLHLFGKVKYLNIGLDEQLQTLQGNSKHELSNIAQCYLECAEVMINDGGERSTNEKNINAIYTALGLITAFVKHPDYKEEKEYRYVTIGGTNHHEFYKNDKTGLTTPCRYCHDDWFLQNNYHEYIIRLGPKVAYADNIKLSIRSRLKNLKKLTIKKSAINYR